MIFFLVALCFLQNVHGYLPTHVGLFDCLIKKHDVTRIQGAHDFHERVMCQSHDRIVMVKIFAKEQQHNSSVRSAYTAFMQQIHTQFPNKFFCSEMELFGANNEHYDLIMHHLHNHGVKRVKFPVVLLFKQQVLCEVVGCESINIEQLHAVARKYCA